MLAEDSLVSMIAGVNRAIAAAWTQGRFPLVLGGDCPVLIGQVPLELLDFVVDPKGRRLIGNPEHGGEQMIEMY